MLLGSLLISLATFLNCPVFASIFHNPECKLFQMKGENVPEGGFFDPNSKDLENAFTNFVLNTHPACKEPGISYNLARMGQVFDSEVVDLELLDACVTINSIVLSKGMEDEDLGSLFSAFWTTTGVFDYSLYNELTQECEDFEELEVEKEKESDNSNEVQTKESKQKRQRRRNRKLRKKQENKPKALKRIPNIMCPNHELIRSTLENSLCQLTISLSVPSLSAERVKLLILNAPTVLLDNPEILDNLRDFSEFTDAESLDKLLKLLESGNLLTEAMVKTLPLPSLFKLIEGKSFEISSKEERLLCSHRPNFELEEPFVSDHRTFRLFADKRTMPSESVDLIIEAAASKSGNVYESVLAYYVRSEQEIAWIFENLSQISFDRHILKAENCDERISLVLSYLIYVFNERSRLNRAFEHDKDVYALLSVPMNGFMRGRGSDAEANLWKLYLKEQFLMAVLPYNLDALKSPEELFGLWTTLTAEKTCEKFRNGRWTANFVKLLFGDEIGESVQEEILMRNHVRLGRFDPRRFDWFLFPFTALINEPKPAMDAPTQEKMSWSYQVKRRARKILSQVNFGDPEQVEAVWKYADAMTALVAFPDILSVKQVDDLVHCERGAALLKANPSVVQRLPSYSSFTLEDMNRFNLNLDDLAYSIGTLNFKTAQEWLAQQDFLVNSRVKTLFRPHRTVHVKSVDSWQFVTFEAYRTSFDLAIGLGATDLLRISRITNFDSLEIEEKLSLMARWLIHMDLQLNWMWLLSRFPRFSSAALTTVESLILASIDSVELSALIKKLLLEVGNVNYSAEIIEKISRLIVIMEYRYISTFKFKYVSKDQNQLLDLDSVYQQDSDSVYSVIKNDNEFLISLIQAGPGSERFKRVWRHRAKLLVLTHTDLKTIVPFEGMEAADQGLIPLDDALLQWFILNRVDVERFKIKAELQKRQGLPVDPIPANIPYAIWYDILINK